MGPHWSPCSAAPRAAHHGKYPAGVPANIADVVEVRVGADVSALSTEAATEIARFDAEYGASAIAFVVLLLRSESASSSQIEHLTSSARAIAMADLGRNVRAMQPALSLAERLDGDAILAMHRALMESHQPRIAGRWREQTSQS